MSYRLSKADDENMWQVPSPATSWMMAHLIPTRQHDAEQGDAGARLNNPGGKECLRVAVGDENT